MQNWPKWTRQVKARLGVAVTPHALRRTFRTMLGELGAPPHVGMAALGHAAGDATANAYDKATYFAERVELAERLAIASTCWKPEGMSLRCLGAHDGFPEADARRRELLWTANELLRSRRSLQRCGVVAAHPETIADGGVIGQLTEGGDRLDSRQARAARSLPRIPRRALARAHGKWHSTRFLSRTLHTLSENPVRSGSSTRRGNRDLFRFAGCVLARAKLSKSLSTKAAGLTVRNRA